MNPTTTAIQAALLAASLCAADRAFACPQQEPWPGITCWHAVELPAALGQSSNLLGEADVVRVRIGADSLVCLRSDGTIGFVGPKTIPASIEAMEDAAPWGDGLLLRSAAGRLVAMGGPTLPPAIGTVSSFSASGSNLVYLRPDGTIGGNASLPIGLGAAVEIAATGSGGIARRASGDVVSWSGTAIIEPPDRLGAVEGVAGGSAHFMALRASGAVTCWGSNAFGQCDPPGDLGAVASIAGGRAHSVARGFDGRVRCWGGNDSGQCAVPDGLADVIQIAAGSDRTAALKSDGSVVVWGGGVSTDSVPLRSDAEVVKLSIGGRLIEGWDPCFSIPAPFLYEPHFLAMSSDGGVLGFGANEFERATVPEPARSRAVDVAAGATHSLVALADGRVIAWGQNDTGQCDVPVLPAGAVKVAAGRRHSVVLCANGEILCFGSNQEAQCQVPQGLGAAVAVAAGGVHSMALLADGTVRCWGSNSDGQCDAPAIRGVVKIAAGDRHSVALLSTGSVAAWGWSEAFASDHGDRALTGPGSTPCFDIAAGHFHTVLVGMDGSVLSLGLDEGLCRQMPTVPDVPPALGSVVRVFAGPGLSAASRRPIGSGIPVTLREWCDGDGCDDDGFFLTESVAVTEQYGFQAGLPTLEAWSANTGTSSGLARSLATMSVSVSELGHAARRITVDAFASAARVEADPSSIAYAYVAFVPENLAAITGAWRFIEVSGLAYIRERGGGRLIPLSSEAAVRDGVVLPGWYMVDGYIVADSRPPGPTFVSSRERAVVELSLAPFVSDADMNIDGRVDASDLAVMLAAWGEPGEADLDESGSTDASDLSVLLAGWTN